MLTRQRQHTSGSLHELHHISLHGTGALLLTLQLHAFLLLLQRRPGEQLRSLCLNEIAQMIHLLVDLISLCLCAILHLCAGLLQLLRELLRRVYSLRQLLEPRLQRLTPSLMGCGDLSLLVPLVHTKNEAMRANWNATVEAVEGQLLLGVLCAHHAAFPFCLRSVVVINVYDLVALEQSLRVVTLHAVVTKVAIASHAALRGRLLFAEAAQRTRPSGGGLLPCHHHRRGGVCRGS
mmetsp:Transcript_54248/g.129306  ORF Transcript_54248/g.129306 Transcript_54248/m.129306 type:complete len:235 (-) Transcript_54248:378-1082(-)